MPSNSIVQNNFSYKRGLVLGLTMAEIVLLLLFSILLALSALFLEKEHEVEEAIIQKDEFAKRLQISEEKLGILVSQLSRSDQKEMKKELVRLKERERQIAYLLERLKLDRDELTSENVDLLVERHSRLNETAQALSKAGFPSEPKKLKKLLKRLNNNRTEIAKLAKSLEKALSDNKDLNENINLVKMGLDQKEGQIAHMKRTLERAGKGTEKPACWADKTTRKPKYIYNAGLTNKGIIVRLSEMPPWASARKLPHKAIPFDQVLEPRTFLRKANPVLSWSKRNECRFFVRVFDLTGSAEKATYKRMMRYVESAFYKYEVIDGHWE
jgi:hypothetical protein